MKRIEITTMTKTTVVVQQAEMPTLVLLALDDDEDPVALHFSDAYKLAEALREVAALQLEVSAGLAGFTRKKG